MCNLPSEIWTRIAFFACTDGGRMGAVLQQVSKLVAYGTAVHKNNIIALHIVERAKLCSDYLGSDNQNLKPVHHLLLDTSHSDTSLPRRTARIIQLRILHIVSPYLRSLTVITKARLDETSKSLNFPHLESLSLNCCLLITSAPKLLSLHLTIRPNTLIDCLQFVVELRSRTPAIKHITIVDLAPLCLGYAQLLGNIRLEFETETPSDIVYFVDAIPHLEDPVQYFTLVLPKSLDHVTEKYMEKLQELAAVRMSKTHHFEVLVQGVDGDLETELGVESSQWSDMFHRAVLRGTGTAEVYAEDHRLEGAEL
jgi:hypothetical protein